MSAIVIAEQARIPAWVRDHASFRKWIRSGHFPEHGQFFHLNGELWVDLSMETLVHNVIKGQIAAVLTLLVQAQKLGKFLHDRMVLTNLKALLSTEPDGMFVADETLRSGRVRLEEGDESLK